jgi:hypothetical protein
MPKSRLGIAINYVQNNWEALSRYAISVYLAIDLRPRSVWPGFFPTAGRRRVAQDAGLD